MKKNLLFILILQYFVNIGISQTITYDFKDKTWKEDKQAVTKFKDIKYNSLITIEVININRFLFDATLEASEKNFNTDVPALFQGQIFDLFKKAPITDSAITGELAKDKKEGEKESRSYLKILQDFKENYDDLLKLKSFYNDLQQLVSTDKYATKMEQGKRKYAEILGFDTTFPTVCGANIKLYGRTLLSKALMNYNELMKEPEFTKDSQLKDEVTQIYNDIIKSDYSTIIDKAALLYDKINDEATRIRWASLPPVSCDELEIKIIITPKSNVPDNSFQPEIINTSLYTKGGFKIDFSTGIYTSNLINQQFTTREERNQGDSITGYTLISQKTGPVSLGIMALMHVTYRVSCQWNAGLNFGIGLDVYNNQSLKFLSGGSIILGKHQRFILNGGVAIGLVDRLSSDLEIDKTYPTSPKITTVKVIDFGFYAGITFNITGH